MEQRRYPRKKLQLHLMLKIEDPNPGQTPVYFSAQSIDVSVGGILVQSRGMSIQAYQYLLAKGRDLQFLIQNPLNRTIETVEGRIARFECPGKSESPDPICKVGVAFTQEQKQLIETLVKSVSP